MTALETCRRTLAESARWHERNADALDELGARARAADLAEPGTGGTVYRAGLEELGHV